MVRGAVDEALNAMSDAEADGLPRSARYERSDARIKGLDIISVGLTSRMLLSSLEFSG